MEIKLNVVKFDDGKEYVLVDQIVIDEIIYAYLVSDQDNDDFCIKRIINKNDGQYLSDLEANEFEKALLHFVEKNKEFLDEK